MRKNRIRLTESQLQNIIKESVRRILKENDVYANIAQCLNLREISEESFNEPETMGISEDGFVITLMILGKYFAYNEILSNEDEAFDIAEVLTNDIRQMGGYAELGYIEGFWNGESDTCGRYEKDDDLWMD